MSRGIADGRTRRHRGLARGLAAVGAVTVVALLGWALTPRPSDDVPASGTAQSSRSVRRSQSSRGTDGHSRWRGLSQAGVPLPGAWSDRQDAFRVSADGALSSDTVRIDDLYGPMRAALNTLDALLSRDGDDEQWGQRVSRTMGQDATGESYPLGGERWWFAQRRFDPGKACGFVSPGGGVMADSCPADGVWEWEDTDAILRAGYFTDAYFAVPDGLKVGDLQDPEQATQKLYDAVYVPMDDGMWTFTTYCPAGLSDSQVRVDSHGSEVSGGSAGYVPAGEAGMGAFGTRQRPCRTVEVVVSGQRPFWFTGDASGSD